MSGRCSVRRTDETTSHMMQPVSTTLLEAGEHVARTGLPARRQFFVVAEDRARAVGLGSLAKSVTRQLIAPRDLRASLVSWINFVFLPEAVNRWEATRRLYCDLRFQLCLVVPAHPACCLAHIAGSRAEFAVPSKESARSATTLLGFAVALDVDVRRTASFLH